LSQTFQVLEEPIQYGFVTEHVVKREKKCPGLCLQASLQIEWQCKLLAECQRWELERKLSPTHFLSALWTGEHTL